MPDVADQSFSARLDCHYLLLPPDSVDLRAVLVVALHGFGANPESMLHLTGRLFANSAVFASVQGPNQFFLRPSMGDVGYGWITNRRPAESIRLHHEMVLHVLAEAGRRFRSPKSNDSWLGSRSQWRSTIDSRPLTQVQSEALSASAAACRAIGTTVNTRMCVSAAHLKDERRVLSSPHHRALS